MSEVVLATTKKKPVHAHNATCPMCGASFYANSYRGGKRQTFCSHKCQQEAGRTEVRNLYGPEIRKDAWDGFEVQRTCRHCGGKFWTTPTAIRKGHGIYCGSICSGLARRATTPEEGCVFLGSAGYLRRKWWDTDSGKLRTTNEHRYLWEKANGPVPEGYEIHHIDENKLNNDLSNLCCMLKHDHQVMHHAKPEIWRVLEDGTEQKKCSTCGEFKAYREYPSGHKRPGGECNKCRAYRARLAKKGA